MTPREVEETLSFEDWKDELVLEFIESADMAPDEARDYVENVDWAEFFDAGMTPEEVVIEEMGLWNTP